METKKMAIEITAPKASETWKLNVSVEVPNSLEGWKDHVGEAALLTAIERFHVIRAQDLGRRMKTGGKNHPPSKDAEIISAVQAFKFGVKTVVAAQVTPEAAIAALRAMDPKDLLAAIEMLREKAAEMGASEDSSVEPSVEVVQD